MAACCTNPVEDRDLDRTRALTPAREFWPALTTTRAKRTAVRQLGRRVR
jgi:hypothetical protein